MGTNKDKSDFDFKKPKRYSFNQELPFINVGIPPHLSTDIGD